MILLESLELTPKMALLIDQSLNYDYCHSWLHSCPACARRFSSGNPGLRQRETRTQSTGFRQRCGPGQCDLFSRHSAAWLWLRQQRLSPAPRSQSSAPRSWSYRASASLSPGRNQNTEVQKCTILLSVATHTAHSCAGLRTCCPFRHCKSEIRFYWTHVVQGAEYVYDFWKVHSFIPC